ncbi:MAG: hypothetical protein IPK13_27475 [Deltaproteobacteria bacterium]|nr:hypothetical protein [Deltaproteobacteria bacterium]
MDADHIEMREAMLDFTDRALSPSRDGEFERLPGLRSNEARRILQLEAVHDMLGKFPGDVSVRRVGSDQYRGQSTGVTRCSETRRRATHGTPVSPALEHVDSSSGAIGTAVNRAIRALVKIIGAAPADETTREKWLERLWEAYQDDKIPYIELVGDYWGELCVSKEIASRWADQLIGTYKVAWSPDGLEVEVIEALLHAGVVDESNLRGFFKGVTNCLNALLAAERYDELLALLDMAPYKMWHYRQYGVKALTALGKKAEAIRYAEESRGLNDSAIAIACACEEVLLSSGLADEAYERYGLLANQAGTYAAWFRAVSKKYPHKDAAEILEDLVAHSPGEEGKWFAAAKDAKLFDEAIALANRTPCSPRTPALPAISRRRGRSLPSRLAWPRCAGWWRATATRSPGSMF